MSGITDRVALVTGSSRGIGRAIAIALAREGADVAVNYHTSRDGAEVTAAEVRALGRRAEVYQGDITVKDDCLRLAESALRDFGHVDILVNNGGIGASTIGVPLIIDTTTEQMESLFAHHVMGGFHLSQALLPQMRTLGRGDIIMISSQAAQSLAAKMGPYNIAKAGMEALAHTLAKEERQYGIRVNIVAPGLVDTELGELLVQRLRGLESIADAQKNAPFGFVCKPEDIAQAVVYLCSDAGRYVTNQRLTVNGGGF
jgi:NAD(P)-dependent dehydrogenase (short-subunit alcohol dehydrogenase family)